MNNSVRTVYVLATASRLLTISIAVISYLWTGSYDSSGEIMLLAQQADQSVLQRCLTVFLRWDALYFVHIAEEGYIYEQEHAFFPLLPLAARFFANTALYPIQSLLGKTYTIILAGVTITNVSFVLAAGALYKLSLSLFPRRRKLAFLSAFMFCLSPPSMFMSSIYTESPFAALTFYGMLWFVSGYHLTASLIWGVASAVRSNAIVYAGFFIYNLLTGQTAASLTNLLKTVIYICFTMSGFAIFQYYGYQTFCTASMDRPWCTNTVPLLYSFVQKEYWGNGLFAYYELKQIPNFLLASPIIALSVGGIYKYAKYDWYRFLSLGKVKSRVHERADGYTSDRIAAFIYLWAFLLVYVVTSMHVQVIIRFFTSVPPLYWYTAQILVEGSSGKSNRHRILADVVLSYYILYGLVGIVLFAAFLPPA